MLTILEKFLFEKFPKMPLLVRIITYLSFLFLFIYLILLPKFIDFQILYSADGKDPIIYRGGNVHMHIEGRDYKFVTNEYGYVSIPIVSNIPGPIEIRVLNNDIDREFPLKVNSYNSWRKGPFKINLSNSGIKLATGGMSLAEAQAGMLETPGINPNRALSDKEISSIQWEVITTINWVTHRAYPLNEVNYPFVGPQGPSYSERIMVIQSLERRFSIKIPDEHWKNLTTTGELVDYITKRVVIRNQQNDPAIIPKWNEIQQKYPDNQRPIYKQ